MLNHIQAHWGLKTGMDRSENGCEKWHFLVWNWVWIWKCGRHTPTKNSKEYPPRETNTSNYWHVPTPQRLRFLNTKQLEIPTIKLYQDVQHRKKKQKPDFLDVKERETAAIDWEIHSEKVVGMREELPESRGVKRSLMSTSQWFAISCPWQLEVSRTFSKKAAIKQEQVVNIWNDI